MFVSIFGDVSKDVSSVDIPPQILNSTPSAFEGKLFIGNAKALNQHYLTKYDIKHVLCCSQEQIQRCNAFPVQVQAIDPSYIPQVNAEILENAYGYIATAVSAMQKNILLVDADGLSKAAVIAAYFLMRNKQLSLVQAVNVIEHSRGQRLKLDENMAILLTKFEDYISGRNTMIVVQNQLVPIEPTDAPEHPEETARRSARRKKARIYRDLCAVLVLTVIVSLLAYRLMLPTPRTRLNTPLPSSLISEESEENVTVSQPSPAPMLPFFPAFLPVVIDIKKKSTLPSSLATELDTQAQNLRGLFKQFSDGYIKDYEFYAQSMNQYERLANESLLIEQQIKQEEELEKAYVIPEDYQHADEEYQKELKLAEQLTKLDKERKKIVKIQLTPKVSSLFARRSLILQSYSERNQTMHETLVYAIELLLNSTIFFEDYAKKERNESDAKISSFPLQLQEIDRQLHARNQAILEFQRLNEGYRNDFQQHLSLLKADEESAKESLHRWAVALDNMMIDADRLNEAGQLSNFAEELQKLAKRQLETWQREIITLETRKLELIEQLKQFKAERKKLEQTLNEAKSRLVDWNLRLLTEKSTLQAMDLAIADIDKNGSVSCNAFSIQFAGISSIASYIITSIEKSTFTNACLNSNIEGLQQQVTTIKQDMLPRQQAKIKAMNEYAQKVSKKRVFVDKREALELQKNASALGRDYKAAIRAVNELKELNKQFETVDSELMLARSKLKSADLALKDKEKELLLAEVALREGVQKSRSESVEGVLMRLQGQRQVRQTVAAVDEIDSLYAAEETNLLQLIKNIVGQEEIPVKIQMTTEEVAAELKRIDEEL